jgi:hypothetical protein
VNKQKKTKPIVFEEPMFEEPEEKLMFEVPETQGTTINYEYKVLPVTYGLNGKDMSMIIENIINKKARDGYRYVESIRFSPSEGCLVFERINE